VPTRLVVGLGNPGPEYEGTRHNVGFEVVDRIASVTGRPWRKRASSLLASGDRGAAPFVLAKPQTFMNNSGRAMPALLEEAGRDAALLVVSDDFHLPLGHLRCRAEGSHGGQKGLASILAALPQQPVPRLRVGVGEPPPSQPAEDYVLQRFRRSERAEIEAALERAADLVLRWIEEGDLARLIEAANANGGKGST
jgi:peptidyl-tRNA hydrolase, PTH1 family